jgi:hypothetical protein
MVIRHDRSLTKGLETVNFHVSFYIDKSGAGYWKGIAPMGLFRF